MLLLTPNVYSHQLSLLSLVGQKMSSSLPKLTKCFMAQVPKLVEYIEPHSRASEVGRQGQGVWGWKSLAESSSRAFSGLQKGTYP